MNRLLFPVRSRADAWGLALLVRDLALQAGFDARSAEEVRLVAAELASNAVHHGGGGELKIRSTEGICEIEVQDRGPGFSPEVLRDGGRSDRLGPRGPRPVGETAASWGSGLACARRLSGRLELTNRRSGGARVVAWFSTHERSR